MRFTLTGSGFNSIPNDAVAVIDLAGDPLGNRYSEDPWVVMIIESKSDTEIIFSAEQSFNFGASHTFGAILSNNREIVYWAND